jgi:hypothetical protein
VCFSSIASVWGSKGQAHYAAANHFLDSLVQQRKREGLPALGVNWGPWGGGGMATEEARQYLGAMGVKILEPSANIRVLEDLMVAGNPRAIVADVDWDIFKVLFETRGREALLDEISTAPAVVAEETGRKSAILAELEQAVVNERRPLLERYILCEVADVMGMDRSQLPDTHAAFADMGMDSFLALEFRNRIQKLTGRTMPATMAFDHPSISLLAGHLVSLIMDVPVPGTVPDGAADRRQEEAPGPDHSPLDAMSREELATAIDSELEVIEKDIRRDD